MSQPSPIRHQASQDDVSVEAPSCRRPVQSGGEPPFTAEAPSYSQGLRFSPTPPRSKRNHSSGSVVRLPIHGEGGALVFAHPFPRPYTLRGIAGKSCHWRPPPPPVRTTHPKYAPAGRTAEPKWPPRLYNGSPTDSMGSFYTYIHGYEFVYVYIYICVCR